MKPRYEMYYALRHQYGWLEDSHGFHMDAPELIPAGSISGWSFKYPTAVSREEQESL